MRNAVTLVWGSLSFAPKSELSHFSQKDVNKHRRWSNKTFNFRGFSQMFMWSLYVSKPRHYNNHASVWSGWIYITSTGQEEKDKLTCTQQSSVVIEVIWSYATVFIECFWRVVCHTEANTCILVCCYNRQHAAWVHLYSVFRLSDNVETFYL